MPGLQQRREDFVEAGGLGLDLDAQPWVLPPEAPRAPAAGAGERIRERGALQHVPSVQGEEPQCCRAKSGKSGKRSTRKKGDAEQEEGMERENAVV